MENVFSHYTSHLYALLTSGIRRLMDGMLLNSMAFLHALTAALVDDCRKAFFGTIMRHVKNKILQYVNSGY